MTRLFHRASDRMLSVFAPKTTAGACVPEQGEVYWVSAGSCSCEPSERWIKKTAECRINCTGTCVKTGRTRCTTTQNIC